MPPEILQPDRDLVLGKFFQNFVKMPSHPLEKSTHSAHQLKQSIRKETPQRSHRLKTTLRPTKPANDTSQSSPSMFSRMVARAVRPALPRSTPEVTSSTHRPHRRKGNSYKATPVTNSSRLLYNQKHLDRVREGLKERGYPVHLIRYYGNYYIQWHDNPPEEEPTPLTFKHWHDEHFSGSYLSRIEPALPRLLPANHKKECSRKQERNEQSSPLLPEEHVQQHRAKVQEVINAHQGHTQEGHAISSSHGQSHSHHKTDEDHKHTKQEHHKHHHPEALAQSHNHPPQIIEPQPHVKRVKARKQPEIVDMAGSIGSLAADFASISTFSPERSDGNVPSKGTTQDGRSPVSSKLSKTHHESATQTHSDWEQSLINCYDRDDDGLSDSDGYVTIYYSSSRGGSPPLRKSSPSKRKKSIGTGTAVYRREKVSLTKEKATLRPPYKVDYTGIPLAPNQSEHPMNRKDPFSTDESTFKQYYQRHDQDNKPLRAPDSNAEMLPATVYSESVYSVMTDGKTPMLDAKAAELRREQEAFRRRPLAIPKDHRQPQSKSTQRSKPRPRGPGVDEGFRYSRPWI